MGGTMDTRKILAILKQYLGLIVLFGLALAFLAGVISYYFLTPMYQSSTQILVNQETVAAQELTEGNIKADLKLINTYSGLIKSPVILEKVSEQMAPNLTVEELRNQITVNASADSQLMDITVTNASQRRAAEIANTTATVFQQEVKAIMNLNNVKILSPAEVNNDSASISPMPAFNVVVGLAVGLMLGVGTAFLLAYLDTSIKDEQDVQEALGLPVLSVIPPVDGSSNDGKAAKVALNEKEA
jgi:capsular polysaccharide biosynthesis protein